MLEAPETSNEDINELRRIYDIENTKAQYLESKASTILGFAALTTPILAVVWKFFLDNTGIDGLGYYVFLNIISIGLILFSIKSLIPAINIKYKQPPYHTNANLLLKYIETPPEKFKNKMIRKYSIGIHELSKDNKKTADSIKNSIWILFFGISLSVVSPLTLLLFKSWS